MPVRSLNSAVLIWPDLASVLHIARTWAAQLAKNRPEIKRILCFGSAARGKWGIGSDLDLLLEVASCDIPFYSRFLAFDYPPVPVPVEMLVYTTEELRLMRLERRRFIRDVEACSTVLYDVSEG